MLIKAILLWSARPLDLLTIKCIEYNKINLILWIKSSHISQDYDETMNANLVNTTDA